MELGWLYTPLKYLHILLAIVAVGFNASYGIWLARARGDREQLSSVLRGIKFLDDRFANPAYGLLLVTGLAMVFVGGIPLGTFWISTALGLWLVLIVVGLLAYTPTLRRQIQVLEADGTSEEYERLARRGRIVGIGLAIVALVIVFLMVFKPTGLP